MSSDYALNGVQLRDVQDALRKPLASRSVLIPLGTKAFVTGQLKPVLNDQREEMIKLRQAETDELQDIARKDAINVIQQEIKDLQQPRRPTDPKLEAAESRPETNTPNDSDVPLNPNFFEIREEIDEHGQEVHAEAVNITQHLKLWENEVKNANGEHRTNNVRPHASAIPPPIIPKSDTNSSLGRNKRDSEDVSDSERFTPEKESKPQVSEEQFAALSARLDELALLEEQEHVKQTENRKSAKKLQSKGWSKGFLNKPKTTPNRKATPVSKNSSGDGVAKSQSSSSINTNKGKNLVAQGEQRNDTAMESGRSVGFAQENEIREIPRVGHRSVSEIQKPIRPVEDTVLSNVVRERPKSTRQKQPLTGTAASAKTKTSQEPIPRKLSRFAQQRLGQK